MSHPLTADSCPLTAQEQQSLFEALLSVSDWVRIYFLWRPNLPDEGGNHLIELALAGNATVIITNNLRYLRWGELTFPGLKVLSPAEFLTQYPTP